MEDQKTFTMFKALHYLKDYYKGMACRFFLFYLGRLFTMIEEIVVPILIGLLINLAVYSEFKNAKLFWQVGLLLFGMCLIASAAYYMIYEIYSDFWNTIVERVRIKAYSVVLRMNAEELSASNYGDMVQQIQWQVSECVQLVVKNVINNINNVLYILIAIVILFRINLWIGVSIILLIPISVFISLRWGEKVRRERSKNQNKYGEYIDWVYEVTGNYKEIRIMRAQKYVKNKLIEHQNELIKTDVESGIATLMAQNEIKIADVCIQMVLYIVLAILAVRKQLTIGSVTVAVTFFLALKDCAMTLVEDYFAMQNRLAIITRLSKLLNSPMEQDVEESVDQDFSECEIEFRNVTFGFKGKEPLIRNLSFHLQKGEKLALVGESGCGKSTILYMILGFYRPLEGEILINGKPIQQYTIKSIRKNIGVVQQEVWLFKGSVRENLLMGRCEVTDDELDYACKMAGAYDFIMNMEQGYDTYLDKSERQLSGGQKQRIGLARAFLKKPALLLFDEATSALDSKIEEQVHKNMEKALDNCSAIFVAHRKSAVMICDKVILMKDGMIAEMSSPEDMEKNSEAFRNLFAV